MFRKYKGMRLTYDKQGYIYFLCKRYKRLCKAERALIRECAEDAGGMYKDALLEFITGSKGAVAICDKYFLSESTLERAVKKFYIEMAERLK